jgi:hypothetical protein
MERPADQVTTGKDDFPEAVGLVIAYTEGSSVDALDFWRTTSIDHEHLITALAAIAVFLAGQTGKATGQSLEQVLRCCGTPWSLMALFSEIQVYRLCRYGLHWGRGRGREGLEGGTRLLDLPNQVRTLLSAEGRHVNIPVNPAVDK